MSKSKKITIDVQGTAITVVSHDTGDFISLTDMAKKIGDDVLIYKWLLNRNTLEFIGIREQIHNPAFKGLEFETFRNQAGLNRYSLTPKIWIKATGVPVRDRMPGLAKNLAAVIDKGWIETRKDSFNCGGGN